MENREFAFEAPKRIVPDTSWRGEALADEGSLSDVDILEEMAYYICLFKKDRGKTRAFTKGESG